LEILLINVNKFCLIEDSVTVCKYVIFIHLFFAQWVWGSPYFFPKDNLFTENDAIYTPKN